MKKGITLITLIITIIVVIILVIIPAATLIDQDLITEARLAKRNEKIENFKSIVRATTIQVIDSNNYVDPDVLATDIKGALDDIKGLENVTVTSNEIDDYVVTIPEEEIDFTIEEATGKKLPMFIEDYVTRNELDGR